MTIETKKGITKRFVFVFEDKHGRTHNWSESYSFSNWDNSYMYVILRDVKERGKENGLYFCTYYEE